MHLAHFGVQYLALFRPTQIRPCGPLSRSTVLPHFGAHWKAQFDTYPWERYLGPLEAHLLGLFFGVLMGPMDRPTSSLM